MTLQSSLISGPPSSAAALLSRGDRGSRRARAGGDESVRIAGNESRNRIVISGRAGICADKDRLTTLPLDFGLRALAFLTVDIRDYDLCPFLYKAQTGSALRRC